MNKDTGKPIICWINSIWVLFLLVGCGFSTGNQAEAKTVHLDSQQTQTDIEEISVVSFHEVYRYYDEPFRQILEIIPEIDGFIPIYDLDHQNYPLNVVGVTDNEEKKEAILNEMMKIDSIPENSFFCWSKNKRENRLTNETFYHLFLLKKVSEELKIKTSEIRTAEVQFHQQANQYKIYIKFNETGTEKWGKMTERAVFNHNNNIAMVIDSLVYSIPSINDPIYSGESMIYGFGSEKEAEIMVERIEFSKK